MPLFTDSYTWNFSFTLSDLISLLAVIATLFIAMQTFKLQKYQNKIQDKILANEQFQFKKAIAGQVRILICYFKNDMFQFISPNELNLLSDKSNLLHYFDNEFEKAVSKLFSLYNELRWINGKAYGLLSFKPLRPNLSKEEVIKRNKEIHWEATITSELLYKKLESYNL